MKKARKIVFLVFIAIAILGMFLPIASFEDNSSASLTADIDKQQGKVTSAETQLQRWIDGGKKSEADIQKQRSCWISRLPLQARARTVSNSRFCPASSPPSWKST